MAAIPSAPMPGGGFEGRFIRAVWYGRRSLRQTFWVWHVGITVAGVVLGLLGAYLVLVFGRFPQMAIAVAWLPVTLWSAVGLWRSARATGGTWGEVGKAYTILAATITVFRLMQIVFFGDNPFEPL